VDYSTISAGELALTCFRTGDQLAWTEFVRRFHPLISRVVLRVARQWGEASQHVIDDLIQEAYLKLCADRLRVLQSFKSAHEDAIYGYIKVFTANLVHDHFKVAHSQKRGGGIAIASIDEDGRMPSASTSTPAVLERNVLIQEVEACVQAVSIGPNGVRDRKIFWLYYRAGLAASAIASLPTIGLTTKGVESTVLRLTRLVRERLVVAKQQTAVPKTSEGIRSAESL
jgi:RNA polymerase sigma-70 factor (ECF subfamily)